MKVDVGGALLDGNVGDSITTDVEIAPVCEVDLQYLSFRSVRFSTCSQRQTFMSPNPPPSKPDRLPHALGTALHECIALISTAEVNYSVARHPPEVEGVLSNSTKDWTVAFRIVCRNVSELFVVLGPGLSTRLLSSYRCVTPFERCQLAF